MKRCWSNYGSASLLDNIGSISSYCNCDCEFCYEKGTRGFGITLGRAQLSAKELETRIRCYSVDERKGLLPAGRFSLEPFANPRCMDFLERMHQFAPDELTNITTNGSCLTEDVIARLAELRPVIIAISMNAGSVEMRKRSMRDKYAKGDETALAAIPLLRKYEIPFVGSYVPWPSKPLSDMEEMVHLVNENNGLVARICMPSWTSSTVEEPPFDTQRYWTEIITAIRILREEVSIPIHLMPNMYQLRTIRPVVQGTIKDSPAARSGLRFGDLILGIDNQPVFTRPECSRLLAVRFEDLSITSTLLTVARDGEPVDISIPHVRDPEALSYPYKWIARYDFLKTWGSALGMLLADGFELTSFARLQKITEEYAGKNVLFYTSELGEYQFLEGMQLLGDSAAFVGSCNFYVEKLRPDYWGGNVMIGDLCTFDDLVHQTRSWIEQSGIRPDVVIAPDSFLGPAGRDLLGRCHLDFERALDIEFRPLDCARIMI